MQHGQHIDLPLGRDRIDDLIRQPRHRKHARSRNLANTPKLRELTEHHRGLKDPAHHPLGGALIVLRDPVADRDQIVPRLRREVNLQA